APVAPVKRDDRNDRSHTPFPDLKAPLPVEPRAGSPRAASEAPRAPRDAGGSAADGPKAPAAGFDLLGKGPASVRPEGPLSSRPAPGPNVQTWARSAAPPAAMEIDDLGVVDRLPGPSKAPLPTLPQHDPFADAKPRGV